MMVQQQQTKKKYKRAINFAELMMVLVIIGIIALIAIPSAKPGMIKNEILKIAGLVVEYRIDFATKQILLNNSPSASLTMLKDSSGEFSIAQALTNSDVKEKVITLYQDQLGISKTILSDTNYPNMEGFDDYFFIKGGSYVAFKFNGNCSTTITNLHDPMQMATTNKENSCALIFYDVNGEEEPNTIGTDQYIVSLNKKGLQ